jgi:acyl carrier protein
MNEESLQEQIREIMAGLFSMDAADIGPKSSIETIEKWDSLQHVNLMMALEQEFDVRVDVEDAVEMTTFTAVCETLSRYLGEPA